MTKEAMIKVLRYKAEHIKAKIRPEFFAEVADMLEQESQTFEWCTNCREYDQEKHCCHRWSKVIRDTVEEMKQQPCEDTISRSDAVKVASGYCHPANIAKELAKLPPVQPKPETAHWINNQNGTISCSYCNTWFHKDDRYSYMRYCPYCTVKMAESEE